MHCSGKAVLSLPAQNLSGVSIPIGSRPNKNGHYFKSFKGFIFSVIPWTSMLLPQMHLAQAARSLPYCEIESNGMREK